MTSGNFSFLPENHNGLKQNDYKFGVPLTENQVQDCRKEFGRNVLQQVKQPRWYQVLYRALLHPFNILLTILATASGASGECDTMGIMLVMVFISTALRFHQEYKSQVAAHHLLSYVDKKVGVERCDENGKIRLVEIPAIDLVPGDCVKLNPGDLVPADLIVLRSKDLYVSQASLTGESIPVEKYPVMQLIVQGGICISTTESIPGYTNGKQDHTFLNLPAKTSLKDETKKTKKFSCMTYIRNIAGLSVGLDTDGAVIGNKTLVNLDIPNLCFMGTSVVSGFATCVVQATGSRSFFGQMAVKMGKRRPQNAFQLGVRRISWIFFITMAFMVPPVLILQGVLHHDWTEAFLFALSVAVGLTPEMLPMIVTTTLAKGAMEMAKKKCIVKNLDAIVNLGGIDVLCTDKTGTLTKSVVTLVKHLSPLNMGELAELPLILAYLATDHHYGSHNPLDKAIINFYENEFKGDIIDGIIRLDHVPFDFTRRRVSVLLQIDGEIMEKVFICKGAVDEILAVCSKVWIRTETLHSKFVPDDRESCEMTPAMIAELKCTNERLNSDGMRVIGVAYKTIKEKGAIVADVSMECELTFVGFITFLDPPKESTRGAIQSLLANNIQIKVLTGDSAAVCKKVCEEIDLHVGHIVTSADIETSCGSDEAMSELARRGTIFTKLTPLQKADLIRALKRNGHIVGFLGDGINDAPALMEADVGISVDTGMDIAKESADIILLEKDLGVVVDGVVIGRATYGNTLKYIVMAISSNFGNVFSMLVASAWLPFPPMKPIHILVQNLLYDISQIAIPWDHMDPEFLAIPHRWSMRSVLRFMACMGPWSSVFDILTFVYMFYYFGIQSPTDDVPLFQTTWFTVGLLTQTMIVHMIRTAKVPFIQSRAASPVIFMTALIMGIGLSLPHIPQVAFWLQMVELKGMVYPFVAGAIFAYCIVAQLAKVAYKSLFNEWF